MKNNRLLYGLAIIKFMLPYCLANSYYQPHRDEYLYLAEGHHLAWGFMEVPPVLSVLAWVTNTLGDSIFWIKFWPALFGALTFIVAGKIIISLGGKMFSLLLLFLPFVFTGYIRLFYFFHPNFLDVFFWTMMAFSLFKYIWSGANKWLYLLGVSMGLGMMSKYSSSFYLISLFAGLLLTRQRKIFANKHFYFAVALGLLIMLPNMVWQYEHRWPVVTHMHELRDEQLQYINPVDFLISQLLLFVTCFFMWMAGIVYVLTNKGKEYRLFAWAYVCVIALLVCMHGKDYYAMGAYPVLFATGCYALEQWTEKRYKWLRYVFLILPVLAGLKILTILMPIYKPERLADIYKNAHLEHSGILRWEDQKDHALPQDFADLVGWKETAMKAGKVYRSIPDTEKRAMLVYCKNYYFAGALNFYAKEAGLPEAYSDDASFLLWMPVKYDIKYLLYVGGDPGRDNMILQQFGKVTVADSVADPYFRENGVKIILLEEPNASVNSIIAQAVAARKARFTR